MARFGLKLMSELRSPATLLEQAVTAERRGLDFVNLSDHIHPWLPEHEHSPFAWSVLGAIAAHTERVDIITGVTCPILRYHPVVIGQAAATVGVMSGGRFRLGVGAGEALNEHVTGQGFPAVDVRHEMLAEAIEIFRGLWTGEYVTYRGAHFDADHVRIHDLPSEPIEIVVAVSGDDGLDLAAAVRAEGIMSTEPESALVDGWTSRGGRQATTWTEVPMAWSSDPDEGRRFARRFRFGVPGWDVQSELTNPKHFAAATATVTDDEIAGSVPSGPDPEPYVEAVQQFLDAGFEHLALVPVGDDLEGTLDFFEREVRPKLSL